MSRCVWCGKESNEVKEIMVLSPNRVVANRYEVPLFVCPEHEEKLQRSCDRLRRDGGSSSVLFIILTFALVISAIIALYLDKHVWSLYLLQTNLAVVGLKLVVFPVGLGIPGSIRFAKFNKLQRIMGGIILAGTGVAIAFMCRAAYFASLASDLASLNS
jgi:hypothetical protein